MYKRAGRRSQTLETRFYQNRREVASTGKYFGGEREIGRKERNFHTLDEEEIERERGRRKADRFSDDSRTESFLWNDQGSRSLAIYRRKQMRFAYSAGAPESTCTCMILAVQDRGRRETAPARPTWT